MSAVQESINVLINQEAEVLSVPVARLPPQVSITPLATDATSSSQQQIVTARSHTLDNPQPSTSTAVYNMRELLNRPLKRKADEMEDDNQRCPICLDSWDSTGAHRLCSLACGHLFGMSCIVEWTNRKRVRERHCPQCKKPCKKRDIRPIFAASVQAQDVINLKNLQQQLAIVKEEKHELELELLKTKRIVDELRMVIAGKTPNLQSLPSRLTPNQSSEESADNSQSTL